MLRRTRLTLIGFVLVVGGALSEDFRLPKGWKADQSHEFAYQTCGILLQNKPALGLIIPERLDLASFVPTREVRLSSSHGVTFPGGKVDGRVSVSANVESLELVDNTTRR